MNEMWESYFRTNRPNMAEPKSNIFKYDLWLCSVCVWGKKVKPTNYLYLLPLLLSGCDYDFGKKNNA